MPFDTSLRSTCIFLAVFILAFLPQAFPVGLAPFLRPFELLNPQSWVSAKTSPTTCTCCRPTTDTNTREFAMSWFQKQFVLPSRGRGSYLITDHIVNEIPEIKNYKVGLLHLFVQHTSCALSLNENWDAEVREDMSDALDRIAPEDKKGKLYRHSAEGPDDMPAHIKSTLVGASITVPISGGHLNLGTWQGIYLLEFRNVKHTRKVVATIQGEKVS